MTNRYLEETMVLVWLMTGDLSGRPPPQIWRQQSRNSGEKKAAKGNRGIQAAHKCSRKNDEASQDACSKANARTAVRELVVVGTNPLNPKESYQGPKTYTTTSVKQTKEQPASIAGTPPAEVEMLNRGGR